LGAPMLVLAAQVGSAAHVTGHLDFLELRHGDAQRVPDPPESSVPRFVWRTRYLFQEVSPKGIVPPTDRTVWLANPLRNDMQVTNGSEEIGHRAEFLVHVDLFQIGLREPFRVIAIILVRAFQKNLGLPENTFSPDYWSALIVLGEMQLVSPGGELLVPT